MKGPIMGWVLTWSLLLGGMAQAAQEARILSFTPQGEVKGGRQVRASFSEAMVPLGDPRGLIEPFEVDCPERGTARWADSKNWIYDFEKDLPAGIRCEFRLKSQTKALSGKVIAGQRSFSFSTGGPAVVGSVPYQGSRDIDEEQVFILSLDAEPAPDSVLENVFFAIQGIQDRVGVRIVTGNEREEILKAWYRGSERPPRPQILIQCRQRFPAGSEVRLIWGRGVRASTGVSRAQDQVIPFKVRPRFTATFHCERENPRAGCLPMLPMRVKFSARVPKSEAEKVLLRGAQGEVRRPQISEPEDVWAVEFPGPFPEEAQYQLEIPSGLKDDAGRPLSNADRFPLSVRTDRYPPLAKFPARFGIVELMGDRMLPVTLRNLEPELKARAIHMGESQGIVGKLQAKILNLGPSNAEDLQSALRRVAAASRESSMFSAQEKLTEFKLPKPNGAKAFEVVGIPLKAPGLHLIELESQILGSSLLDPPGPMFVPTAALLTNLSVHFKWGRETSLVWVTSLDKAQPVEGAEVTVRDCRERLLWSGKSDAQGIARIDAPLPSPQELPRCPLDADRLDSPQMGALRWLGGGIFVVARTSSDMAFVHSSWDQGIEPWRFQLPTDLDGGPLIGHTILDRALLRAGETVHMKHILRQHTTRGFRLVPEAKRPQLVSIEHLGSGQIYEFPLAWDSKGVAETTWSIPKEAKLGSYRVVLRLKQDPAGKKGPSAARESGEGERLYEPEDADAWTTAQFRVEEFRVPLMKAVIQPSLEPLVKAGEATLDLSVQYLAGGGAGGLPVKLRREVRYRSLPPPEGFEGFEFSNGPVREGISRRGEELEQDELLGELPESLRETLGASRAKLAPMDLVLDKAGSARVSFKDLPQVSVPMEMLAELEYRDPNGEVQTASSRVGLWPSRLLIGLKPSSWAVVDQDQDLQVGVVDLAGKPVAGAPVKVELFQRKTISHRKRIVGGFYAYEHAWETKRLGVICQGKTDQHGRFLCQVRPQVSGELVLQAQTEDQDGNPSMANRAVWVSKQRRWWFDAPDHDRIDLIPEKSRYEPGETATFQVRMGFKEATALVTVEREGVMEAWVKPLSGQRPIIQIPVKGSYAPNVFVSALVVRGRVKDVAPTALVDLGKPAFKLGISEIKVGWGAHELKVSVSTDKKVYQVRQKAFVKIKVQSQDLKPPPPGSEVAVAAVDEGLLELMPNKSWEILPAMMRRRPYEVSSATAQMQVVGKRHYGLKALPPGGGGGKQPTRELFDTLLLWRARVPLDQEGEASLELPLNDSITSFRIVAVATGGEGLFGTGSAAIQSTQDLMILSGLPPLVREGDRFRAGFTLRNTTQLPLTVEVSAAAKGLQEKLEPMVVSLNSGEAREVGWEVTAPAGQESLSWEVELKAKGAKDGDRIKLTQKVAPVIPVRTLQATMAQLEGAFNFPVEPPPEALLGRGGLQIRLSPRIGEGLSGVVHYMKSYPYGCMEQKISMAVALRDEALWNRWMAQLASHLDSDGLVKYFSSMNLGCPVLTSYILAIAHEAGWEIPPEAKEKMASGLIKFVEGRILRYSPLPTADLSIRKLSALEALSRVGKAQPKHLGSIPIEPNLWPTSALIDWLNLLRRVPGIPEQEKRLQEAGQILRSRLNFQGTAMSFSTEEMDRLWWLMVSTHVNAVRTILAVLPMAEWKEEIPRLVRGALGLQRKGRWDLTVANAWGVLAMEKFSKAFEALPVTGKTSLNMEAQTSFLDWGGSPGGGAFFFPWPQAVRPMRIIHEGTGSPWVTIQGLAAIPLKSPLSSGYKIRKHVSALERKRADGWSRGDLLRVRLEMEAQADQTWVVVSDPIPAGASILGGGLGRDSGILTTGESSKGWARPVFQERSFEALRAYFEFVPKGEWILEYTLRLNQEGRFHVPPTRVEALYSPEMFGEIPNEPLEVGQ